MLKRFDNVTIPFCCIYEFVHVGSIIIYGRTDLKMELQKPIKSVSTCLCRIILYRCEV